MLHISWYFVAHFVDVPLRDIICLSSSLSSTSSLYICKGWKTFDIISLNRANATKRSRFFFIAHCIFTTERLFSTSFSQGVVPSTHPNLFKIRYLPKARKKLAQGIASNIGPFLEVGENSFPTRKQLYLLNHQEAEKEWLISHMFYFLLQVMIRSAWCSYSTWQNIAQGSGRGGSLVVGTPLLGVCASLWSYPQVRTGLPMLLTKYSC